MQWYHSLLELPHFTVCIYHLAFSYTVVFLISFLCKTLESGDWVLTPSSNPRKFQHCALYATDTQGMFKEWKMLCPHYLSVSWHSLHLCSIVPSPSRKHHITLVDGWASWAEPKSWLLCISVPTYCWKTLQAALLWGSSSRNNEKGNSHHWKQNLGVYICTIFCNVWVHYLFNYHCHNIKHIISHIYCRVFMLINLTFLRMIKLPKNRVSNLYTGRQAIGVEVRQIWIRSLVLSLHSQVTVFFEPVS